MATIKINGVSLSGNNIVIVDGKITVDGKDVTPEQKEIAISVDGNVERLEVDSCASLSIAGDAGNVKTVSGDVSVSGDIKGSVNNVSGDVNCDGTIVGSVNTVSGDINF